MNAPEWLIQLVEAIKDTVQDAWQVIHANPLYETIFWLVVAAFAILLLFRLGFWAFEPTEEAKQKRQEELAKRRSPGYQPNPTNGLVTPGVEYPLLVKLSEIDQDQKPRGETAYTVRAGPKEPVFLFLDARWLRLEPIQSLDHEKIKSIQDQIRDGVRKPVAGDEGKSKNQRRFEEIFPPGHFQLNGIAWKLEETRLFAGELLRGQLFSFKGGKGVIELIFGSPVLSQEGVQLVLEKTIDQYRRAVNETWTSFDVSPSSFEEVTFQVGEETLSFLGVKSQPTS